MGVVVVVVNSHFRCRVGLSVCLSSGHPASYASEGIESAVVPERLLSREEQSGLRTSSGGNGGVIVCS